MNPEDVKPHDISVSERSTPVGGGKFETRKTVTYYVGSHGPFTLEYAPGDYSAANVKRDIQKEIDSLAEIHQWAGA
jgi:hypothetical protein